MAHLGRGRAPYWAAIRLAGWLSRPGNWNDLDGRLTLSGASLDALDARRSLNAVYACLIEGRDEKERAKFDRDLIAKPRVRQRGSLPATGSRDGSGIAQMMHLMSMPKMVG